MRHLDTIYVQSDGSTDQEHMELVFMFYDEDKDECSEYRLEFLEGMPMDDFQSFFQMCASRMWKEEPTVCIDG